jgi:hypothetical protein
MKLQHARKGERRGVSPPVQACSDCTLYRPTYVAPLACREGAKVVAIGPSRFLASSPRAKILDAGSQGGNDSSQRVVALAQMAAQKANPMAADLTSAGIS